MRGMWQIGLIFILACHIAPAAYAEDWQKQLAGLKGVVIWCTDASRDKLGANICSKFLDQTAGKFSQKNIPVERVGFLTEKDAQPDYDSLREKLAYRLFIRGVKDGVLSLQLRVRASVAYQAAVESDSGAHPRSGDLVLWERSTTGSGPAKGLEQQIADFVLGYSAENLDAIVAGWPR